jgi:hypothetical protein
MSNQIKVVDSYADRLLEMFKGVSYGFENDEFHEFVNNSYEVVRNYNRNKNCDCDDYEKLKALREWCVAYLNLDLKMCKY